MTVTSSLNTFSSCLNNFTEAHRTVTAARAQASARLGCAILCSILALATGVGAIVGAFLISPYFALLCIASVLLATIATIILLKVQIPIYDLTTPTPITRVGRYEVDGAADALRKIVTDAWEEVQSGLWDDILPSRVTSSATSELSTPDADNVAPLSPTSEDTSSPEDSSVNNQPPVKTTESSN